ncbi:MAG: aldo/keto reductase [Ilumatobacter sp.]|uniref:aldo/keto reductase n=1 Tax=Ilumatobacter sp. TaxID=1967498 RepID=UPI003918FF87
MELRTLGRTGVKVSRLGLGTMVLGAWGNQDHDACARIIHKALDAGINLVDTADMYALGESEEIVGAALHGRRDEVVVATKFHNPMGDDPNRRGNSRRWITQAVDDSLRRLRTDRIDLYQVHRPDPSTDIVETVDALTDLVRAGKILAWGTSTFPAEELVETWRAADRRSVAGPHTEQPPYSILCRGIERDVLPVCRRNGMGVLAWSPLSGGWLTGKYRRDTPPPADSRAVNKPDHFDGSNETKLDAVERLAQIADTAGITLTELALAWAVEHPGVTSALIGPRTEEQLDDLLRAGDLRLDTDTLDAIDLVVAPGTDINPADRGWTPPSLATDQRRRPVGSPVRSPDSSPEDRS